MSVKIKVGLLGASGRMGQYVSRLIQTEFFGEAVLSASASQGDSLNALLQSDAVIDFSSVKGMRELAKVAHQAAKADRSLPVFVVGSTGWKPDEKKELKALAEYTPIVMASNFSTGVLALLEILKQAGPLLAKLNYTPVLLETHHRHKKDAPSGTALTLHRSIAPHFPGTASIHSVRAGEVIGDHEITFYGPADRITLGHFAQDRTIFARGAVEVALWLAHKRNKSKNLCGMIPLEAYFKERIQ